jgi:hypothetical protein
MVTITCILGKRAVGPTGKGTGSELYPAIFCYLWSYTCGFCDQVHLRSLRTVSVRTREFGCLILCVVLLSPSVSHSQTIIKNFSPVEFKSHAYGSWTANWQQTDDSATSVSAEGTAQPSWRVHEMSARHYAWPHPCSMEYLHLWAKPANAHFTFSQPCTVIYRFRQKNVHTL